MKLVNLITVVLFGHLLLSFAWLGICTAAASRRLLVAEGSATAFDQNYVVDWGADRVQRASDGALLQLTMDKTSGSGFMSKVAYGSGFFHLVIKIPNKDTAGVVTAFYLSSSTSNHDELDFEFLGNRIGKPITLQTNIFTNGHGNREQRIQLWFDPSVDFHDYKVLWNPYQIVFFVDEVPIRVFENQTSRGVEYPTRPMKIVASLWDGSDWATDGGKAKIDWTQAPFVAQFEGFNVDGCPSQGSSLSNSYSSCSSSDLWWNGEAYRQLSPAQMSAFEKAKPRITYDYCSDKQRFPTLPPECQR